MYSIVQKTAGILISCREELQGESEAWKAYAAEKLEETGKYGHIFGPYETEAEALAEAKNYRFTSCLQFLDSTTDDGLYYVVGRIYIEAAEWEIDKYGDYSHVDSSSHYTDLPEKWE